MEGERSTVRINIDGISAEVPEGSTIMEAADSMGIYIPRLCHFDGIEDIGICKVCVVEIEGKKGMHPSCMTKVEEGMVVHTSTPSLRRARRSIVGAIMMKHPRDCFTCERNSDCELLSLARDVGISSVPPSPPMPDRPVTETEAMVWNPSKCVLCGRCIRVCDAVQGVGALSFSGTGLNRMVSVDTQRCTFCGQCLLACPTDAILERSDTEDVWSALSDPEKHVVVQTAPAIRSALGEAFGLAPGEPVTGKMYAVLRRLGFDMVFDTTFGADVAVMEEATELIRRMEGEGPLPMLTSCCPAWVRFAEEFYPDILDHISEAKSPQAMTGALIKTYYADVSGIDPENIVSVSVMPCTAKKYEASREDMRTGGMRDVDHVLTTRELIRMIEQAGIDLAGLPDEEPDHLMGLHSGAGSIFGAGGGAMEAAVRTAYRMMTGNDLEVVELDELRENRDIKSATIDVGGRHLRVAVVQGLKNAVEILEDIRNGSSPYHAVEIMACPGGCVGGGGQPRNFDADAILMRKRALYTEDRALPYRTSCDNPAVKRLYSEYLGEPMGEKAMEILHTRRSSSGSPSG